jgi:poly(A) polymerase
MSRLSGQAWLDAPETQGVMRALEGARAGSARFVGGCVRNALLSAPVDDIDIATQLLPEQVAQVMRAAGYAVHETGLAHGTLTIVANHKPFEVTTLRRDVETDGRRAVVAFTEDWAEDAARRDFRINALYADVSGAIFDPTGSGMADLDARRVVFVGDAETRIREDYLRILRFFRFNAWYGCEPFDRVGLEACATLREGLAHISVERSWMETKKLLAAPDPVASVTAMAAAGVLSQLYPGASNLGRLKRLVAVEAHLGLAPDWPQRLAALFDERDALIEAVRVMKPSNDEALRLRCAIPEVASPSPSMSDQEARRALYATSAQSFRDHVLRSFADDVTHAFDWTRLLKQADEWRAVQLPVTGDDLIARGVKPGPELGAQLKQLETAWIASDFSASRKELLASLQD